MRTLQQAHFHRFAALALAAGIVGCEAPVALDQPTHDLVPMAAANRAAGVEAGIPIDAHVVVQIVSLGPCASESDVRLSLEGNGLAAGLGPFELQYGYCAPSYTDWSIVLRTRAGELTLRSLGGTGVMPSDHPDFDIEAHDTWEIVDGTRKFRYASGEIQADFYANLDQNDQLVNGEMNTVLSGTIEMGRR